MLRAIREIQPRYVVGENVAGLISWSGGLVFDEVQTDLENEGYEVWPFILPAAGVNAPHRRDRVWFIAHSNGAKQGNDIRANTATAGDIRRENESDVLGEFCRTGITPDANNTRSRIELRANGIWQEKNKGREELSQSEFGANCWDVTNTERSSSEGQHEQRQEQREFGRCNCKNDATNPGLLGQAKCEKQTARVEQCCKNVTTNTNSRRQPSEEHGETKSGWATKKSVPGNWQNFPTQPPICSGNDGISERLDGITFPKWRNESIKAYGNAIVPQVALQIFKAIQIADRQNREGNF